MATSKGGRGNKSITKLVEEWVEQGFSATMIKELLKDAGYQKGRISQLLRPLKEFAEATTPEAIPCQRCGFPWCKCKACKQKKKTTNAKQKHTCWLPHYGPHPYTVSKDPIYNKRVPDTWVEARDAAWASEDSDVIWDGATKAYKKMRPAPAAEGGMPAEGAVKEEACSSSSSTSS